VVVRQAVQRGLLLAALEQLDKDLRVVRELPITPHIELVAAGAGLAVLAVMETPVEWRGMAV
jgi:hypothetical protein